MKNFSILLIERVFPPFCQKNFRLAVWRAFLC